MFLNMEITLACADSYPCCSLVFDYLHCNLETIFYLFFLSQKIFLKEFFHFILKFDFLIFYIVICMFFLFIILTLILKFIIFPLI